MANPPLLSVVIPTHNRARYARYAIESILSIKSPLLQLVVHDTSVSDELEVFVAEHVSDERLKYIRYRDRLSLTENHNAAMKAADGEYVCLIGDDDTIMPEAIEATQWARDNAIDALTPTVVANYAWPDFRSRFFGMAHAGRLYIKPDFRKARLVDAKVALRKSLQRSAQGTEDLPKIYHGIIRRSVMEEIRRKSGNYFHGSSPDASGALGIALMISTFVEMDYPLTLPGAAGSSASGRSAVNTHKGKLAEDPQTAGFVKAGWPREVPRFFSVETVWAHAGIETIRQIQPNRLKDFDFIRLYATCWLKHKDYRKETLEAYALYLAEPGHSVAFPRLALVGKMIQVMAETFWRLSRRLMIPTAAGGRYYIPELKTIADAQTALLDYLKGKNHSFGAFIAKDLANSAKGLNVKTTEAMLG
ncbi:MAG: glycosyltransferase family 2 protein [Alphaproteobacteria bacterium]|nr:glycosyltransferase family 2 protein [Alphaproteobacteria bacterium]